MVSFCMPSDTHMAVFVLQYYWHLSAKIALIYKKNNTWNKREFLLKYADPFSNITISLCLAHCFVESSEPTRRDNQVLSWIILVISTSQDELLATKHQWYNSRSYKAFLYVVPFFQTHWRCTCPKSFIVVSSDCKTQCQF